MYGSFCRVDYGMGNHLFHEEAAPRIRQAFSSFCEPLILKDQIIYSDKNILNKFIGSKILILGGGGSTNTFLDSSPDLSKYDYIWSMNHFFLNDYIYNNLHVDLFSVGPEVKLNNDKLISYLDNHKTIAAFELHQKWARDFINPDTGQTVEEIWKETEEFYYPNLKTVFQTKFYSQLGAGVRLIIYAAALNVSEIFFIGLDGPNNIIAGNHAFETGKTQFPSAVRHLTNKQKIDFFTHQYLVFWSYLKKFFPKIKVHSIDKDNELHRSIQE